MPNPAPLPAPALLSENNKVPVVTTGFWIIKILSTTAGETAADYLAVDVGLGLWISSLLMTLVLAAALFFQLRLTRHVPGIYWLSVVLISIAGTQITDILTDKLEISLYASTTVFFLLLITLFAVWYTLENTLSIRAIYPGRREWFYWAIILCTFAAGTAAGDLATEALGLGFRMGTLVFTLMLFAVFVSFRLGGNATFCFWTAYILTRPLGASLGDWLAQSPQYGGLGVGASSTSLVFLASIFVLVVFAQQRESRFSHNNPS